MYRFTLVLGAKVRIRNVSTSKNNDQTHITKHKATSQLLMVCKQFQKEGMSILYGENKYEFLHIQFFDQVVGNPSMAYVSDITILHRIYGRDNASYEMGAPVIKLFSNLKKLCFETGTYACKRGPCPEKVSKLTSGTVVSNTDPWEKPDSIPPLSRELIDWFLAKGDLNVRMVNKVCQDSEEMMAVSCRSQTVMMPLILTA